MNDDILWGVILIILGNIIYWFREKIYKIFPKDPNDPTDYTYEQRINKMILGGIGFLILGLFLVIRATIF